jgi:hypothetical protein
MWHPAVKSMLYLHAIDGRAVVSFGTDGEFELGSGDALAVTRARASPLRVESRGPSARLLMLECSSDTA